MAERIASKRRPPWAPELSGVAQLLQKDGALRPQGRYVASMTANQFRRNLYRMAEGRPFAFNKLWDAEQKQVLSINSWKADGRPAEYRQILNMSIADRLVHRVVATRVGPLLDPISGPEVSGNRWDKESGLNNALSRIQGFREAGLTFFLRLDVKDYDGTIDHKILMEMLRGAIGSRMSTEEWTDMEAILAEYLRTSSEILDSPGKGMLGGSHLAGLLNNFYLTPVDRVLRETHLQFIRAGDDYVIASRELISEYVLDALRGALKELGLAAHPEKTKACDLGQELEMPVVQGCSDIFRIPHLADQYPNQVFDFGGICFYGARIAIREQTLLKILNNVERITDLRPPHLNDPLKTSRLIGLEKALTRINHRLGFSYECDSGKGTHKKPRFYSVGWAILVKRILSMSGGQNEELLHQCRSIDSYIRGRLGRWLNFDRRAASPAEIRAFNTRLRGMGLRGFVDVYNYYCASTCSPNACSTTQA